VPGCAARIGLLPSPTGRWLAPNRSPTEGLVFRSGADGKHLLKDSTPATPALSLIYALDVQLDRILAEGLEIRFARHRAMSQRVQGWAQESGLEIFAADVIGRKQ